MNAGISKRKRQLAVLASLFAFLVLVVLTSPARAADPTCSTGILNTNGSVCCSAACGACGGSPADCSSRPGGMGNCCGPPIKGAGRSCHAVDPPCEIVQPDPTCSTGVLNADGDVCCDPACGTCGGPGCGQRTAGGSDSCCLNAIRNAANSCDDFGAPCVMPPPLYSYSIELESSYSKLGCLPIAPNIECYTNVTGTVVGVDEDGDGVLRWRPQSYWQTPPANEEISELVISFDLVTRNADATSTASCRTAFTLSRTIHPDAWIIVPTTSGSHLFGEGDFRVSDFFHWGPSSYSDEETLSHQQGGASFTCDGDYASGEVNTSFTFNVVATEVTE